MALATTASYSQLVVEISEDGTVWNRICGMTDATISYDTQTDEDEIPDCDDESLPHTVVRSVRSVGLTVTGEGKWSQESHEVLVQWWLTGELKRFRVGYTNATTGDVEYIDSTGTLTMTDSRTKGQTSSRQITIQSASAIATTDKL